MNMLYVLGTSSWDLKEADLNKTQSKIQSYIEGIAPIGLAHECMLNFLNILGEERLSSGGSAAECHPIRRYLSLHHETLMSSCTLGLARN